jgi:hypothetical protein
VSEEELDAAQIGAELEEVGGKGVTEDVRRGGLGETGLLRRESQGIAHRLARDASMAVVAGKQERPCGTAASPVRAELGQQPWAERHVALASPLAVPDANQHSCAVDVVDAQGSGLADAQSCRVERHDQSPVLRGRQSGEDPLDLGGGEDDGGLGDHAQMRDARDFVATPQRPAEQGDESGGVHVDGARALVLANSKVFQVGTDVGHRQLQGRASKEPNEPPAAASVRGEGVGGACPAEPDRDTASSRWDP